MEFYNYLTMLGEARACGDICAATADYLHDLGFDNFVAGQISRDGRHTRHFCDTFGPIWWKHAMGLNGSEARARFAKLCEQGHQPFELPSDLFEEVNARLTGAGQSAAAAPPVVGTSATPSGFAFIVCTGPTLAALSNVTLNRIAALPAAIAANMHRLEARQSDPLTARERETLEHTARGLNSAATARAMGISERTVLAHIASAMVKLGAPNRVAAVVTALKRRIIEA